MGSPCHHVPAIMGLHHFHLLRSILRRRERLQKYLHARNWWGSVWVKGVGGGGGGGGAQIKLSVGVWGFRACGF